jgi:hypothetical protein
MAFKGRITFDRELTFSKAREIALYCQEHKYGLMLTQDGRGLLARKSDIPLEQAVSDLLEHVLKPAGLKVAGVIRVLGEESYDVVVIKNMVKLYKSGQITTVTPTKR